MVELVASKEQAIDKIEFRRGEEIQGAVSSVAAAAELHKGYDAFEQGSRKVTCVVIGIVLGKDIDGFSDYIQW